MKLDDALYNWLQIRIVADARPDDQAAKDTADFFTAMLTEDHQIERLLIRPKGDELIQIVYTKEGVEHTKTYDRGMSEQLLHDINANPKYNE